MSPRSIVLVIAGIVVITTSGGSATAATSAMSIVPGTLIRCDRSATISYVDRTGRRRPFPNEFTYRTWYPRGARIQKLSPARCARIAVGSNVTVRPGIALLKEKRRPTVYAVSVPNILRPLASESIARALYGPRWSAPTTRGGSLHVIADRTIRDYVIGASIDDPGTYDRRHTLASITSIGELISSRDTSSTPTPVAPPTTPVARLDRGDATLEVTPLRSPPPIPLAGNATPTPAPSSPPSGGGGGGGSAPTTGSTTTSPNPPTVPATAAPSTGAPARTPTPPAAVSPGTTNGPPAPDDLGPAPAGGTTMTALEIRNDQVIDRPDELAYSGVSLRQDLNLRTVDQLAVVGPGDRLLNAQFRVLARWNGGPHENDRPIRWVEVATRANVPAGATVQYLLRQYPTTVSRGASLARGQGDAWVIDTGAAQYTIDGRSHAVIQNGVIGGRIIIASTTGAGPRLIDVDGRPVTANVDANGFALEENGPVRAIVRSSGHFGRSSGPCGQPLAYDARLTFVRGSPHIGVAFDIRNECGDGYSIDWQGNRHLVRAVEWRLPLALDPASTRSAVGTDSSVALSPVGAPGTVAIAQQVGAPGTSGWRRAHAQRDGATVAAAPGFAKPIVALGDARTTASAQLAWMQWREPQTLAADGTTLVLGFLGDRSGIGEAQARWNIAQFRFATSAPTDALIAEERDRGAVALERGLLIHTPVTYLNSTRVMPRLPERSTGPIIERYVRHIEEVHRATITDQWLRNKTFGIFWPDIPVSSAQNATPADYAVGSNYWSPTSSEFQEFLRTGDPKWVWDFAYPAEQTFWKTNVYNLGTRSAPDDIRSGFGIGKGDVGELGQAYRNVTSSDDYFYNQGADEFYLIRPNRAIATIFARGCDTFLRRYGAPRNQGQQYTSRFEIIRQVSQHLNALRYGAEFGEDPAVNARCVAKLRAVMQEYAEDNFVGGIACIDDSGNAQSCTTDENFMHVGMHLDAFLGYVFAFGDHSVRTAGGRTVNDAIRRAMVGTARQFAERLVARQGADINVTGDWANALRCTFADEGTRLASCTGLRYNEPLYDHAKPMAIASMLIAHDLDPSSNLCSIATRALPAAMDGEFADFFQSGHGWTKGTSQSMRMIAFGIGGTERCTDAAASTSATPPAATTAPPAPVPATTNVVPQVETPAPVTTSTVGLPSSTYTLKIGEAANLDVADRPWTLLFDHTIGQGTCFGTDFVKYEFYLRALGQEQFERVSSHTGPAVAPLTGGHEVEGQGCAKGRFLYTLRPGTYDAAMCVTNTNNVNQRYCTAPLRVTTR